MLLRLELSNFNIGNWRSTIRNQVKVHEKYQSMAPWVGGETADIVYEDSNGEFRDFLMDHQHARFENRPSDSAKYYVEVKSTIKSCHDRFFVSDAQYKRVSNPQSHLQPQGMTCGTDARFKAGEGRFI
jgi:hypothetical protein